MNGGLWFTRMDFEQAARREGFSNFQRCLDKEGQPTDEYADSVVQRMYRVWLSVAHPVNEHGRRPAMWAAICNGRAVRLSANKPTGPGEPGWELLEAKGYEPPVPLFLSAPKPSPSGMAVICERQRQITQKRYTPERDDLYTDGELALAAAGYALASAGRHGDAERVWPWPNYPLRAKNPVAALVKAGGVIIAELERRARAGQ